MTHVTDCGYRARREAYDRYIPSGGSNLGSVEAALFRLGADFATSDDPKIIAKADQVIFPGVGHAETMMARLHAKKLSEFLTRLTQPVLGICLGMQLLFESSEEGAVAGLGIIPGRVRAIPKRGLPLPHMGWNEVKSSTNLPNAHPLTRCADNRYFYFVHSFEADSGPWVEAVCDYGGHIPALVRWRNFHGVQFHPERSGASGEDLLKEFLCMN